MRPWVQDADDTTAAELLSIYEGELDETYIAFSGNAALGSDVDPSGIHYHTIWRDHERDYGAEFNF